MTSPLPPVSPGVVLVAPTSPKGGSYGEGAPSLVPGQTIYFRVLPASASGEIRLRIGAQTLTAAGQRPLAEGSSGTAVVKAAGPPIVLQITELRAAAAPEPVRLPVLLGRESLGTAASLPPGFLEKWNQVLQRQNASESAVASSERIREGILLARAVVSALVLHAGGEAVLRRLTGMHRMPSASEAPPAAPGEKAADGSTRTSGDAPTAEGKRTETEATGAAPQRSGRPVAPEDLSARELSSAPVGLGKPAPSPSAKGVPSPSASPTPQGAGERVGGEARPTGPAPGGAGETPGPGANRGGTPPQHPGRPVAPEDLSARELSSAPVGLGKPAPPPSARGVPSPSAPPTPQGAGERGGIRDAASVPGGVFSSRALRDGPRGGMPAIPGTGESVAPPPDASPLGAPEGGAGASPRPTGAPTRDVAGHAGPAAFGEDEPPMQRTGDGFIVPAGARSAGEGGDTAPDVSFVAKGSPDAAPPGADDIPFWFFIPFPGEKTPVLFPGYRRHSRGGKDTAWNIFLRLPELGAVSVRFQTGTGGWRLEFAAEHEPFVRALIEGSAAFTETLRARGFSVREVVVRRLPGGQMEAEVGAALSSDLGIPLVERRA